jgi:ABC-type Mn2+/Zn2+ transport system permease subunit
MKAIVTMAYGVAVIVNGMLRGTTAAIGFGVVMGALALAGSVLMFQHKRFWGTVLAVIATLFVAGFFGQRLFMETFDTRYAVMVGLSLVELVVLFFRKKQA